MEATLPPGPADRLGPQAIATAYQQDPLAFLHEISLTYPDLATLGSDPLWIACFQPGHALTILRDHADSFCKVNLEGGPNLRKFLGNSVLTSEGEEHQCQRKQLWPLLRPSEVAKSGESVVRLTRKMLARWAAGSTISLKEEFRQLVLTLILQLFFPEQEDVEQVAQVATALETVLLYLGRHPGPFRVPEQRAQPPVAYHEARATLAAFIHSLLRTGSSSRLIKQMAPMSADEGLAHHILTLLAAGYEAPHSVLVWACQLLGSSPEAAQKLRAELGAIVGQQDPCVDHLKSLPFLAAVLKEASRLYPPAWMISRQATREIAIGGYRFPAGANFMVCPWILHRSPSTWGPDAEKFRPERWLAPLPSKVPSGAYIPFGLGPRTCIGMPLAQVALPLILATIWQEVLLQAHPQGPIPLKAGITLRPAGNIFATVCSPPERSLPS